MKEIDFLPEWYRRGRIQKRKHRDYYIALGLIFAIMVSWSIFADSRVAKAKAKNLRLQNVQFIQAQAAGKYNKTQLEYKQIKTEADILDSIETKMSVSSVMAELTHLLNGRVVLSKVEIKAELFAQTGNGTNQVRVAKGSSLNKSDISRKVRFRVILAGVAANATEVAQLISELEESEYFLQVIPRFSRNKIIDGYRMSEFEISCYLANYTMSR